MNNAKIQAESPKDLADFRSEIEAFRLGVRALREDPRLLLAFRLMNETSGSRHLNRWHLFQIVFIVSMLPSLLARERPDVPRWRNELDIADVLWFPTGGGKTEAYFGIIVTAMFYDRLRGGRSGERQRGSATRCGCSRFSSCSVLSSSSRARRWSADAWHR